MQEQYQQIGYIKKPHGIRGEIKIKLESQFLEDLLAAKVVFIDQNGRPVPYFIEEVQLGHVQTIKLEDVNSREDAQALSASLLFLRTNDLLSPSEKIIQQVDELEFGFLAGYQLFDHQDQVIGQIVEVQAFPQQEMALVDYQDKNILVPLHQHLILDIDKIEQKIRLKLPEGLLEL